MEPTDLTIRILQEIRDEQRATREELRGELQGVREEMREDREMTNERFGAIETTLRDLAEQSVMMARGIRVALESRGRFEDRLDDHEGRLKVLETADD